MGAAGAVAEPPVKDDEQTKQDPPKGVSSQQKIEPPNAPAKASADEDDKPLTAYVVLAKGGPGDEGGGIGFEPLDVDTEEKLGDVVQAHPEVDERGQGPSVFRAKSAKDARKQAAAKIEGLSAWLLEDEGNAIELAAVPASSWKPTRLVVLRAEPTIGEA